MNAKRINNIKVEPIIQQGGDTRQVVGKDLFPEAFANIFLLGRKKKGKTSCIFTILKKCLTPETVIYIFCSTIHKDANWIFMTKWLEKNGYNFLVYTTLVGNLTDLLETFKDPDDVEEEEEEEKESPLLIFEEPRKQRKSVVKKPKYIPLENCFIFDDIGDEIKSPALVQLLKKNRHIKSKIIISSQYCKDVPPAGRQQIDYWILYPSLNDETLEEVYSSGDINTGGDDEVKTKSKKKKYDLNKFIDLYKKIAPLKDEKGKQSFDFLYVDTRDNKFRKNFSHELDI